MTNITNSTAVRQLNPAICALILCALRLGLKIEGQPELPLRGGGR